MNVQGRRVLIIEDNPDAVTILRICLRQKGHLVETAFNGVEGLEKFDSFGPEVVFLDIGLPGMSGYEVAEAIREKERGLDKQTLLVALTGYGQPSDKAKSVEAGIDKHIVKPPETNELDSVFEHPKIHKCI